MYIYIYVHVYEVMQGPQEINWIEPDRVGADHHLPVIQEQGALDLRLVRGVLKMRLQPPFVG